MTKDKATAREQIRPVENEPVLDSFLYIEGFFPGSLLGFFFPIKKQPFHLELHSMATPEPH